MYKLVNPKPHFIPMDICRIVGTNEMVIIKEVNCNLCQDKDEHQWSYSVILIDEKSKTTKCAWYNFNELEKVNNIFEIISINLMHPFSNSDYKFNLDEKRRAN